MGLPCYGCAYIETCRLKNGVDEHKPLVATVLFLLRKMFDSDPMALYELTMLCRDPEHTVWGNILDRHPDLAPRDPDGRYHIHDSVRNVVLSAVKGVDLDMHLVSPYAESEQQP